jgi:hypothetical protein
VQTIHDFVRDHKIRLSCKHADRNPHMSGDGDWQADHWRCTLSRPGGKRMTVYFSMGVGHGGKQPDAADVLNSLALDSSGYENNQNFESWASEYGYDPDSRSMHKTFLIVKKQAVALKRFVGGAYEDLLFNTEGL